MRVISKIQLLNIKLILTGILTPSHPFGQLQIVHGLLLSADRQLDESPYAKISPSQVRCIEGLIGLRQQNEPRARNIDSMQEAMPQRDANGETQRSIHPF